MVQHDATASRVDVAAPQRRDEPSRRASHLDMTLRWSAKTAALLVTVFVLGASGLAWYRVRHAAKPGLRNVVLIGLDTCRADHLGSYGYGRDTTPNIDALAREGVLFRQAYSTNPMTLPAHSSMLTGTTPPYHGVHDNNSYSLAESNRTLAEMLREAKLATAGFVGAFVLDRQFGLGQGFDTYGDKLAGEGVPGDATYNERRADAVSGEALAWLEQHHDEPFFLFLHYFDAHQPYSPPEPFASEYADDPYAGEIAYTDSQIGVVIDKLKSLGLYDSTLLIVTADHGQGLGEHGEESHSFFVYQGMIHVPLIVRMPGGSRGAAVDEPVSLADVVPTVLGLRGLPIPPQVTGRDLSAAVLGRDRPTGNDVVYFESVTPMKFGCEALRGVIELTSKYNSYAGPELYDLRRDWLEGTNLADAEPRTAHALDGRLREILADADRTATAASAPPADPKTRQRLESLGYVTSRVGDAAAVRGETEAPRECFALYVRLSHALDFSKEGRVDEAKAECLEIVAEHPDVAWAHSLLGAIAARQRQPEVAVAHLAKYFELLGEDTAHPASERVVDTQRSHAHNLMGMALVDLGQLDDAIEHFRQAVQWEKGFAAAEHNLGNALEGKGEYAAAGERYRAALEIEPDLTMSRTGLGRALYRQGAVGEAVSQLTVALAAAPDDFEAHKYLALALERQGKVADAIVHYRRALEAQDDDLLYNNLAWIYATAADPRTRNESEAVELARRGAELTSFRDPGMLDTLAAAYAAVGRFDEAVSTSRQALALLPPAATDQLAVGLRERLALYERGQAYREPASKEHAPPA